VSSSAAISVADHSRSTYSSRRWTGSRSLRCSRLVLGWTETPAVRSHVRTVSLVGRSAPECACRRRTSGADPPPAASPGVPGAAAPPVACARPVLGVSSTLGRPAPRTSGRSRRRPGVGRRTAQSAWFCPTSMVVAPWAPGGGGCRAGGAPRSPW
jgi:hypothetical protein